MLTRELEEIHRGIASAQVQRAIKIFDPYILEFVSQKIEENPEL